MKVTNVSDSQNKLIKFNSKRVNLEEDYEYFVHISSNGKRCHLSKEDKSIKKLSNNTINKSDEYLSYIIDVGNKVLELVKKKISCFYRALIIVKENKNVINDWLMYFPMIEDDLANEIRCELLNE